MTIFASQGQRDLITVIMLILTMIPIVKQMRKSHQGAVTNVDAKAANDEARTATVVPEQGETVYGQWSQANTSSLPYASGSVTGETPVPRFVRQTLDGQGNQRYLVSYGAIWKWLGAISIGIFLVLCIAGIAQEMAKPMRNTTLTLSGYLIVYYVFTLPLTFPISFFLLRQVGKKRAERLNRAMDQYLSPRSSLFP